MTALPNKCPFCKSTEVLKFSKRASTVYKYRPPSVPYRMLGNNEEHNKRVEAINLEAEEQQAIDVVICAKCGSVYAKIVEG